MLLVSNPDTRVNYLFAFAFILQLLDWHSTLTAMPHLIETNTLILSLSDLIGFSAAVGITKAVMVLVLSFMYLYWKRSQRQYSLEFCVTLGVICTVYFYIVSKNYLLS